jgi:hypothetical protein
MLEAQGLVVYHSPRPTNHPALTDLCGLGGFARYLLLCCPVIDTVCYLLLYTSVLKYFRPESAISVTTFASGPNRSAT